MRNSESSFETMNRAKTNPARSIGFRLTLRLMVHFDALLVDPRRYFRAAWSRVTGKRLRGRLLLAPLLGGSRWAYALWLSRGYDSPDARPCRLENAPLIMALVQVGADMERTLSSLASENIPAEKIQGLQTADLARLRRNVSEAWILPMASGDVLAPGAGALYREAAATATDDTLVIYADDDIIDAHLHRSTPHLKPDWNSELFRHFDYLTGAAILRLSQDSFDDLSDDGWAQQLVSKTIRRSEANNTSVIHLHQILHHRRTRFTPKLPPPRTMLADAHADLPSISILVPTRNGLNLLRNCLNGLARTEYPGPLEVIVIDNGSDHPATLEFLASLDPKFAQVLRDDGPFNFAALNNRAADTASGELLCFLNNDIEIIDPAWLITMCEQALRAEVGAVGARLLYPDGRIQHAGVVMGVGGGAAHAHRLLSPAEPGYFDRHSLPQFVSAVTAACLVVQRHKFLAVGGFDADHFAVSFNDVDLCLRLGSKGWHTLYEPRATLVHHESITRGFDRDLAGSARLARELTALQKRWGPFHLDKGPNRSADPFHHPCLSPFSEQFVLEL